MARILITDDEPSIRLLAGAILKASGHTVLEASSAREALRINEESPVDLVVTDLVMKEMDGTELLRRLRISHPQTRVIAVSGDRHSTIYLNMAKLLGADRILAKPFPPEALATLVEQVLAAA